MGEALDGLDAWGGTSDPGQMGRFTRGPCPLAKLKKAAGPFPAAWYLAGEKRGT